MEYGVKLVNKQLSASPKNINVFDSQYVLQSDKEFVLEVHKLLDLNSYVIKGVDDEILFNGRIKFSSNIELYDINDTLILTLVPDFDITRIYEGKYSKGQQAAVTIFTKNSTKGIKYSVVCFNRETKQKETVDLNCDRFLSKAGLFIGKEKEGAPMVAKFVEINESVFEKIKYSIKIFPGIDYILVIALAIFIRYKKQKR